MKKWLGLLLTATLASCGGSETASAPADQITKNDFESLDGWVNDPTTLTKEKAHSGAYSIVVKPGLDYSLGYVNTLGKMSASRPEKLKITAWVFVPNAQTPAKLVAQLTDPSKQTDNVLLWQGIELNKKVKKFNEWQEIEDYITVPAGAQATSQFRAYLWRADAPQPVYLDDLNLSLANGTK